jgi:hypothetical protein
MLVFALAAHTGAIPAVSATVLLCVFYYAAFALIVHQLHRKFHAVGLLAGCLWLTLRMRLLLPVKAFSEERPSELAPSVIEMDLISLRNARGGDGGARKGSTSSAGGFLSRFRTGSASAEAEVAWQQQRSNNPPNEEHSAQFEEDHNKRKSEHNLRMASVYASKDLMRFSITGNGSDAADIEEMKDAEGRLYFLNSRTKKTGSTREEVTESATRARLRLSTVGRGSQSGRNEAPPGFVLYRASTDT